MQKYATILEVCRLFELGASVRDIRSHLILDIARLILFIPE